MQHHKTPDPISTQFVGPTHNYFTMQFVITSLYCVAITSPAGKGKPTRRCDLFRLAFPEWLKNPGQLLTGRPFSSKVSQRSYYLMLIDLPLSSGAKGLRLRKLLLVKFNSRGLTLYFSKFTDLLSNLKESQAGSLSLQHTHRRAHTRTHITNATASWASQLCPSWRRLTYLRKYLWPVAVKVISHPGGSGSSSVTS